MKIIVSRRFDAVLKTLPEMYVIQPETDYQALISHSPSEIADKAWARTAKQMWVAFDSFEEQNPDVKRQLSQPA